MAITFQINNRIEQSFSKEKIYTIEWDMKNILVTGSKGQLGSELQLLATNYEQFRFFFTDVEELDITDKAAISAFVRIHNIQYIINCAAYTAVDRAEDDEVRCFRINRDAVANLAECASENDIVFLQISTDYVFDGKTYRPYKEDDPASPQSVYGKSKLAGEEAALSICKKTVVVRTAWLYSSFGNNFVKTMLRLGRERDCLNVVFDQVGSPTYAADLAVALLSIIVESEKGNFVPGIYHFSNEGVCSWYDFAKCIHRLYGITSCAVSPIESCDYITKAQRPHYSVLNKHKIKTVFATPVPYWEDSLKLCIDKLKKEDF